MPTSLAAYGNNMGDHPVKRTGCPRRIWQFSTLANLWAVS
jgi:hypothetical protein